MRETHENLCVRCRNREFCDVTIDGDFTIDECTGFEEINDERPDN